VRNLVVLNIAGLSPALLEQKDRLKCISSLRSNGFYVPIQPVFPAVTSSVQATLTTGLTPALHGVVGNGWLDRERLSVDFWSHSARLVRGTRLWELAKRREPDFTVAALCWQQMMGSGVDYLLTPSPIHTPDGRMISSCYSRPAGLYDRLVEKHGPFSLTSYWGPLAGIRSSQWIGEATRHILRVFQPTLTMTYLPHLDYSLQKYGPHAPEIGPELDAIDAVVGDIVDTAAEVGGDVLILSEYGISPVSSGLCINRLLRQADLLVVREVDGREYLDIAESRAFAVVDHQIAHIYAHDGLVNETAQILEQTPGIEKVLDAEGKRGMGIDHERSGELIAIAEADRWFAYYWWEDPDRAPAFAGTVDIHNKPGFDPVELFFDPKNRCVPVDETLVKGSHGRLPEDEANAAVFIAPQPPSSGPVVGRLDAVHVSELLLDMLLG